MDSLAITSFDVVHALAWAGAVIGPALAAAWWLRLDRDDRQRGWAMVRLGLFAAAYAVAAWGFLIEPSTLAVRRAAIVSPQWRGPPLRIGLISDTHVGSPPYHDKRLAWLMARMNAERPDVIVFLGDYAAGHEAMGDRSAGDRAQVLQGAAILGQARAPLGSYGVLGNHDWWFDGPAIEAAAQGAGVRMLENAAVRVERTGGAFWIAGVADPRSTRTAPSPAEALRDIPPGGPVILLSHRPDVFADTPPRVALTLAAHTHCGQIRLPLIGPVAFPSEGSKPWNCGRYAAGGRQLYVTGGVGTSILPVRFGASPRIDIVTLSAAP